MDNLVLLNVTVKKF